MPADPEPTDPERNGPAGNHFDKYASHNGIERRMMQGFLATFEGMVEGLAPRFVLEVGADVVPLHDAPFSGSTLQT